MIKLVRPILGMFYRKFETRFSKVVIREFYQQFQLATWLQMLHINLLRDLGLTTLGTLKKSILCQENIRNYKHYFRISKISLELIHHYLVLLFSATLINLSKKHVTFNTFKNGILWITLRGALNYCAVVRGDQIAWYIKYRSL